MVRGAGQSARITRHPGTVGFRYLGGILRRLGPLRRAREGALIGCWRPRHAMTKDRTPASTPGRTEPIKGSGRSEIDAFLQSVRDLGPTVQSGRRGRLIFALDATMSRQPLWDT